MHDILPLYLFSRCAHGGVNIYQLTRRSSGIISTTPSGGCRIIFTRGTWSFPSRRAPVFARHVVTRDKRFSKGGHFGWTNNEACINIITVQSMAVGTQYWDTVESGIKQLN